MNQRKTHTPFPSEDWVERQGGLKRLQQRQELLERMESSAVVQKRFWGTAKIAKPNECWNWTGTLFKRGGYARFSITENGKNIRLRANRVAYYFVTKKHPGRFFVCHSCDNPKCINPSHMFLGTHKINQLDKVSKGRTPKGNQHSNRVLTEEIVKEMRHRCLVRGETRAAVADDLGFNRSTVVYAVLGINWKHVPFPKEVS